MRSYAEIAEILARVIGQPFVYEQRPPHEFLAAALAAGADPTYTQSAYENYAAYTAGTNRGEEKLFSSFADVTGRKAASVEDFIRRHRDAFAY